MKYALGLDFGTLSVRALLVTPDGREDAAAVSFYRHGVMEGSLPDGTALPAGFALADPADYLDSMAEAVQGVLKQVNEPEIIGIGIDCTSSSVLPVDADMQPLCMQHRWYSHPQAWLKLWKHHGAENQAGRMARIAAKRGESWLPQHGGQVSCELLLPKALETLEEDPEVWHACAHYLEMGDWLCWYLTGNPARAEAMAACNALFTSGEYPAVGFWQEVSPGSGDIADRLLALVLPMDRPAGGLRKEAAGKLGLPDGIPVAPPLIDSHASVLGAGASQAGDLTAVIGTSACWLLNAEKPVYGIPGVYSAVYQANAPGLYGLEAGQSCVGDALDWLIRTCIPAEETSKARQHGASLHDWLSEQAEQLPPGGHGLTMLDWLNGARSPLMRPEMTGAAVGFTLKTSPAEMYRAMVEACCCGARRIVSAYEDSGLPVRRIVAAGGIPLKNPFFMQTLADVLGKDIQICESRYASALGAAVAGAAVSGKHGSLNSCIGRMAADCRTVRRRDFGKDYDAVYQRYLKLSSLME